MFLEPLLSLQPSLRVSSSTITLRPLRIDDAPLLYQLYQRTSETSLYFRYFRPYRPTLAELQQLCQLKTPEGMGYLALTKSPQTLAVGVAHYVIEPERPTRAEVAFLVDDHFQGKGIGRLLFQQLQRHANQQALQTLSAYVHPTNEAMMRIFRRSGLPMEVQCSYGVCEVQLGLNPASHKTQPSPYRSAGVLCRVGRYTVE